jgi:hypothetical protein
MSVKEVGSVNESIFYKTMHERHTSYTPRENELEREINRRIKARALFLKELGQEFKDKNRPKKPTQFKAIYQGAKFQSELIGDKSHLTAHHLLSYNDIRKKFAHALINDDRKAMQSILAFSGVFSGLDSSEVFRFFSRKCDSSSQLTQEIRELFEKMSWLKHNVFLGPSPLLRGEEDPRDKLDCRESSPLVSEIARQIFENGFKNIDALDLANKVRVATANYIPDFNEEEWTLNSQGFFSQIKPLENSLPIEIEVKTPEKSWTIWQVFWNSLSFLRR